MCCVAMYVQQRRQELEFSACVSILGVTRGVPQDILSLPAWCFTGLFFIIIF